MVLSNGLFFISQSLNPSSVLLEGFFDGILGSGLSYMKN